MSGYYANLMQTLGGFARYFASNPDNTNNGPRYASSYGPFKPTFVPPFRRPRNNDEAQYLYNHIRTIAWYMDALPFLSQAGLPFRVGVDDIISLFPLWGDLAGSILALYQIFLSWLFGVPPITLGWMALNVLVDLLVGLVPVIGDIADVLWKANLRNLDLLEGWLLNDPAAARFSISLMPKNEFLPKAGRRSARRGAQANGRDRYRAPPRTERMKKGQYVPEDLD
ncbi:hypothetical protein CALVIDRAFT_561847 [Calocera viscosa TUFC12733]|uniref:DUF4112 domain-containing protein n=1 Tax=Calocera viscosa (strain TUFC12733) TaxID=1330018 RepID=A0A167PLE8_CALVF|nr:hypothetical protein CALVIDRAFT_561847 [Calocera viscosa TUFC12733]